MKDIKNKRASIEKEQLFKLIREHCTDAERVLAELKAPIENACTETREKIERMIYKVSRRNGFKYLVNAKTQRIFATLEEARAYRDSVSTPRKAATKVFKVDDFIFFVKAENIYRVKVARKAIKLNKSFKTLEEAQAYRDEHMKEHLSAQ